MIATQWEEDSKVKFKQVELTTHNLDDLFVDIGVTRVSDPSNLRRPLPGSPGDTRDFRPPGPPRPHQTVQGVREPLSGVRMTGPWGAETVLPPVRPAL
ncbi:hypothetical protein [Streptomyces sp. NPDC054952]